MGECNINPAWRKLIEKFISHKVWFSTESSFYSKQMLHLRLERRLTEMKERKKKIARMSFHNLDGFEEDFKKQELKKQMIIVGFSS